MKRTRDDDFGQASSSSSSRGVNTEQKLVRDNTDTTLLLLEELARRLKTNKEGLDEETVTQWREKIQSLAADALHIQHADHLYEETTKAVAAEKLAGNNSNSSGSSSSSSSSSSSGSATLETLNLGEIKKEIVSRVEQEMKSFKADGQEQFAAIAALCNPPKEEDEDIIIDDNEELTEQAIACPFTMTVMLDPYKNTNPKAACIHHISKLGLDALLKKTAAANCPVAGCRGKWTREHSVPDETFKRRVERHLRFQEARTQHTQSAADPIDIL